MDAWEILHGNSSLPAGDAWEHLNAQEGGGGSSCQDLAQVLLLVKVAVFTEAMSPAAHAAQVKPQEFFVSAAITVYAADCQNAVFAAQVKEGINGRCR